MRRVYCSVARQESSTQLCSKLDCEGPGQGGDEAYHHTHDRDTAEIPGEGQNSGLNNDKI